LELTSRDEWHAYCQGRIHGLGERPEDIPSNAEKVYRQAGWHSWGDWLGTGRIANFCRRFRPYREARQFARSLGLRGLSQWRAYCRGQRPELPELPIDVPRKPDQTYQGRGWGGWVDWLGADARRRH
jgi:hypothetical protein